MNVLNSTEQGICTPLTLEQSMLSRSNKKPKFFTFAKYIIPNNKEIYKEIKKPEKIDDLGYKHEEQISLLQSIQDVFLNEQRNFLVPDKCTICGSSKISKSGSLPSDFHSVYTDHKLRIPRIMCCNKNCSRGNINISIYSSNFLSHLAP